MCVCVCVYECPSHVCVVRSHSHFLKEISTFLCCITGCEGLTTFLHVIIFTDIHIGEMNNGLFVKNHPESMPKGFLNKYIAHTICDKGWDEKALI